MNKLLFYIHFLNVVFEVHQLWKYKLDHVLFWLITILFYAFTRKHSIETSGWPHFLADVLSRNALIAAACYINVYVLFDRHFRKGRYFVYTLSLLLLLTSYILLQYAFDSWLNKTGKTNFLFNSYYNFSIGIFYLAFTLALELSKRWYHQQNLLRKIHTEKLQTELQYLKAQLNPHFLFNSINTIYFQIDRSNENARESLRKFSDLLRYQLYECNEDKIPIEKETTYLQNYIDLQKLRKDNNNNITINIDDNVRDFFIAPLLLIPFVENAFKHLSDNSSGANSIQLNMDRKNGHFIFSIANSVNDEIPDNGLTGIGLKNVKRRLDLLYENRYKLAIQKNDERFTVELQLEIP